MKKLTLRLEDLQIDSFHTTTVRKENGTVLGEQCTCPSACSCPGCPTCDASCGGTCDESCGGTCGDTCDESCHGLCASYLPDCTVSNLRTACDGYDCS